jgi:hypothetical protein
MLRKPLFISGLVIKGLYYPQGYPQGYQGLFGGYCFFPNSRAFPVASVPFWRFPLFLFGAWLPFGLAFLWLHEAKKANQTKQTPHTSTKKKKKKKKRVSLECLVWVVFFVWYANPRYPSGGVPDVPFWGFAWLLFGLASLWPSFPLASRSQKGIPNKKNHRD